MVRKKGSKKEESHIEWLPNIGVPSTSDKHSRSKNISEAKVVKHIGLVPSSTSNKSESLFMHSLIYFLVCYSSKDLLSRSGHVKEDTRLVKAAVVTIRPVLGYEATTKGLCCTLLVPTHHLPRYFRAHREISKARTLSCLISDMSLGMVLSKIDTFQIHGQTDWQALQLALNHRCTIAEFIH